MASVKKDNPVEESRKRPAPSPAASHPSGPILTPSISNKKHSPSSAASMAATPSSITSRGNAVTEVIGGKASKGLRHFSMEVCKKVEEKGATTYNEVADELVKEYMEKQKACESSDDDDEEPIITGGKAPKKKPAKKKKKTTGYDEKNIRRRVYDALNVLMAMDIIGREKKEIRWKGLPSNAHHDLENMQRKREMKIADVHRKREELRDLIVQKVCFRNLVTRNQSKEAAGFIPRSKSSKEASHGGDGDVLEADDAIQLPFIVVNTSSKAVIQCEMSSDRSDVMFDFSLPFEINDDTMILKRLGMNQTSMIDLCNMFPRDLMAYCQEHQLINTELDIKPTPGHPGYPPHPSMGMYGGGYGPPQGAGHPGGYGGPPPPGYGHPPHPVQHMQGGPMPPQTNSSYGPPQGGYHAGPPVHRSGGGSLDAAARMPYE